VHGAADRLDGYKDQLDSLLSTLQLVQDEPELHTAPIEQQVQVIIGLSEELQRYVDDLAARLAKSKARQYTHALTSGERDEKALDGICTRLDQAKTDLNVRILTTNVGLSGSLRSGFTAALAIVQRVDRNVQRVLGERLPIATQLEGRNLGTGAV
jgi:predicted transcriptional regulator